MSARRRFATLCVAVGGVLAGHWLTYVAVAPAASSRSEILHQTGHAYLAMANDVVLVVALAALASMFIGQLSDPHPAGRLGGTAARVVRFQVSAFVLLEVLERVTAGSPISELVRTGILPIGVVVQIAVGCLAGSLITALLRTADRVAAAFGRAAVTPRRVVPRPLPPDAVVVASRRFLSAAGVRGPPSTV